MILAIPEGVLRYFLYFSCMAFVGWIIETVYRSSMEKRFVNPGFLSGPFVPIYGFGAVAITAVGRAALGVSPLAAWIAMALAPTVLEYATSYLLERLFGMALWDYKDRRFNVRGRVCLRFSVYWALLAPVLVFGINPYVFAWLSGPGPYLNHFFAGALASYFLIDAARSVKSVFDFKAALRDIRALVAQGRSFLPSFDPGGSNRLPSELRRLVRPLGAFPSLARDLRPHLHAFPEWIRERIELRIGRRR